MTDATNNTRSKEIDDYFESLVYPTWDEFMRAPAPPPLEPINWVEIEELTNYPLLTITEVGEENVYFTHNGNRYFYKY